MLRIASPGYASWTLPRYARTLASSHWRRSEFSEQIKKNREPPRAAQEPLHDRDGTIAANVVAAISDGRFTVSDRHHTDVLGVAEWPEITGEGRGRGVADDALSSTVEQHTVTAERFSKVLHARRVDEVVDSAVGVQQ